MTDLRRNCWPSAFGRTDLADLFDPAFARRKRPLTTAAQPACWGAADRVKHTVLKDVAKDSNAHGDRDHLDGRAAAS